eukprot:147002-Chlamydomonas_euryale.AAC.5
MCVLRAHAVGAGGVGHAGAVQNTSTHPARPSPSTPSPLRVQGAHAVGAGGVGPVGAVQHVGRWRAGRAVGQAGCGEGAGQQAGGDAVDAHQQAGRAVQRVPAHARWPAAAGQPPHLPRPAALPPVLDARAAA